MAEWVESGEMDRMVAGMQASSDPIGYLMDRFFEQVGSLIFGPARGTISAAAGQQGEWRRVEIREGARGRGNRPTIHGI